MTIELNNLPCNITEHIMKFRNFLNTAWEALDDIMDNHDWDEDGWFIIDWFQEIGIS